MGHFEIMSLPTPVFCSYIEDISRQAQKAKDRRYFKGSSKLADIWEKNKEQWKGEQNG